MYFAKKAEEEMDGSKHILPDSAELLGIVMGLSDTIQKSRQGDQEGREEGKEETELTLIKQ